MVAKISKYTILGERCSGTNFLENAMENNFKLELTWRHGWKHFFGHDKYQNCDDTLFIGIVRDPLQWLASFYKKKHHLPAHMKKNWNTFLFSKVISINENKNNQEIMGDRHIYTGNRYQNMFDLRKVKSQFLLNDMPKRVKHFILIRYEDLRDRYEQTMSKICQQFKLESKTNQWIKVDQYQKSPSTKFRKKVYQLTDEIKKIINDNIDWQVESRLGYSKRI